MENMGNQSIKVSVVVPVYNTQNYLEECMDSILAQTLTEIQIICVDDGSTDNSPAMLDCYAEKDERIQVLHIANSGYGHAVNLGMNHAQGKYISIVEPDDYIEKGMLERLYTVSEKYGLDMVNADCMHFSGQEGDRIFQKSRMINDDSLYNTVINPFYEREIFKGGFINPAGLFNREFLNQNDIRHNETPGASFQDAGFGFQVLAYAERVMLLTETFYCYRQDNPNSSINNGQKMNCIIEEYEFILNIIRKDKERLDSFIPEYTRRKVGSYLNMYNRLVPELRLEFLKMISRDFQETKKKGEFITTGLSESQQIQVKLIMDKAEEFYKRDCTLSDEIHKKVNNFEQFIVYGVGMFGKKIYDVMLDEDKGKIKGFAVTDAQNNIKEYRGVPVRQIDSFHRDSPVIVGVMGKYTEEVISTLEQKGWKNIICLESKKWFQNV